MIVGAPVRITRKDGTVHDCAVTMAAIAEFERSRGSLVDSLVNTRKLSDTWYLAWESARSAGIKVKPFDAWLAELADITIDWSEVDEGKDATA